MMQKKNKSYFINIYLKQAAYIIFLILLYSVIYFQEFFHEKWGMFMMKTPVVMSISPFIMQMLPSFPVSNYKDRNLSFANTLR